MRRDLSATIQCAQPVQQVAGLRIGWGRGQVEPAQIGGIADTPLRQFKRQRRQIGRQHFGRGVERQRPVLTLRPEPIADTRLQPPGAAPPLIGGGLADLDRLQPGHAAAGIEPGHSHQPAVDDDADAFDGQAGFGDGGCQHDLPQTRRCRADRGILPVLGQIAIEWSDQDAGIGGSLRQQFFHPANLRDAGQEDQDVAGFLIKRHQRGGSHRILDPASARWVDVAGFNRERAALRRDDGGVVQQPGDGGTIQRRRHDQQAQVVAQDRLCLEAEGQA